MDISKEAIISFLTEIEASITTAKRMITEDNYGNYKALNILNTRVSGEYLERSGVLEMKLYKESTTKKA